MDSARRRTERRIVAGLVLGVVTLAGLTLALLATRPALTSVALLYLVPVVIVAAVGGVWPGIVAAAAGDALLNWFFVPPYHTFAVQRRDNIVALLVYVLVALVVAAAMDLAARQRSAAVRSEVEAALLARISGEPLATRSLEALLGHVRETFGMTSVALVENGRAVAAVGPAIAVDEPAPPGMTRLTADGGGPAAVWDADAESATIEGEGAAVRLVAQGPELIGEDHQLLQRLATATARMLAATREADRAARLAEVDRVRTAILAAVGHDLRTPLAGIKAAASSLRSPDVAFSDEDRDELLATVEESADRLGDLVENLLAMSRLQAGVLSVDLRPVALDEVVARALLYENASGVRVRVGDDLPLVLADPGLLERVIANLVSNAVKAAHGNPIELVGAADHAGVRLAVIDHGAGISAAERDRIFAPFQRLGDTRADGGLGLGLAIARGFTEAMGGTLVPTDTPHGGLTMTLSLRTAL